MGIVHANSVRATSGKRRNKIVQEITRNVANFFSFYAIIAIEHVFQCINIRQVPWEVLKTAASGLGFNTSHGTWRMLMHENPCLIPILKVRFRASKTGLSPSLPQNFSYLPFQGVSSSAVLFCLPAGGFICCICFAIICSSFLLLLVSRDWLIELILLPKQPSTIMPSWSVYLTTLFQDKLCPLSG